MKSGIAARKPSRTIAAKKPTIQPNAAAVLRSVTSWGRWSESWKSCVAMRASGRRITHSTSAAARQNSGMPMASGNSAAFHGQASALTTAHAARIMLPMPSASDARLRMRVLARTPRLDEWETDHGDGEAEQHQHHGPRKPGRLVARHRYIEIVFSDLAEHQAEDERRARPSAQHHQVADGAEGKRHQQVAIVVVRCKAADENQHQDHRYQQVRAHIGQRG